MANKRLQQVFVKRETLPGTLASSLIVAANGKLRVKDPQMTASVEQYDREIYYGSISALQPLAGKVEMQTSFAVELAGITSGDTSAPAWSDLLEACGMRLATIVGALWPGGFGGSATGTAKVAKHGDLWQTASAAKVIRVFHDNYESTTPGTATRTIFHEMITGTPAAADVYWPVSSTLAVGPTITLDTGGGPGLQRGYGWYPTSDEVMTATFSAVSGTQVAGDIYKGGTSGAIIQNYGGTEFSAAASQKFRVIDGVPASGGEVFTSLTNGSLTATISGTPAYVQLEIPTISIALVKDGRVITSIGNRGSVKIVADVGKPVFLEFTFKGVFSSAASLGTLSDVPSNAKVPPRFQGVDVQFASQKSGEPGYFKSDTTHRPRLLSASFDLGAEANLQTDATSNTGVGLAAHITGVRKAQGSVKIDVRPEGAWPLLNKLVASETWGMKMRICDPSSAAQANNTFLISTPGNKTTGVTPTDTNNYDQDDVNFAMSAANPDGSDGDKREMVLTYHFATTGTLAT